MINKEFYGDKLLAIILEGNCHKLYRAVYDESCMGVGKCKDCKFCNVESIENWLNAEHVKPEPLLLENGYGLKPGDWIMVRDGDGVSWRKRQFMCYFDNHFCCFKPHSQFKNECACVMWAQARLPMKGEKS